MSCGNVALPGSSGPSHWRGGWGRRGARGPSPWPQLTTHRPHHDCGRVTNARGPAACNSHVMTHVPSAGQEARQDTARGLSHSTRGLRGGTRTLSGTCGRGPRSSAGVRVACARVASPVTWASSQCGSLGVVRLLWQRPPDRKSQEQAEAASRRLDDPPCKSCSLAFATLCRSRRSRRPAQVPGEGTSTRPLSGSCVGERVHLRET